MKQQNTQYFAGLVRQLTELSNKSITLPCLRAAVHVVFRLGTEKRSPKTSRSLILTRNLKTAYDSSIIKLIHYWSENVKPIMLIHRVLMLFVLAASFVSCGARNAASSTTETRIVTDVWGREVRIPLEVKTIAALGSGAPRIAAYLGVMDMLSGGERSDAENFTVLRDYNPVHHAALRELPVLGSGGGSGNNNAFPEELIKAAPDVILAAFSAEAADELFSQTNIPVVCVRYFSVNFIDDTFYRAVKVFAEVTNTQKRGEEVLAFINAHKVELNQRTRNRTQNISVAERLRVYAGAVTFNGRQGFFGTYSNFGPLMGINARNVADETGMEGFFEANPEQVIMWNPDIIFLDPGNIDLVHSEYATNPTFFNSLKAVREKRTYTMPAFNYAGTNVTYALINAYFAGTVLFPDEFADIDIAEKAREILLFLLGTNTFETMAHNGLYYGQISIGE